MTEGGGMSPLSETDVADLVKQHPDAAMVTLRPDGAPHMARVELGVVDGRVRTAGSPELVRTRHLRRDPRCSLFVFGPHPWWLGLETEGAMLDGPGAAEHLVRLMRARHPATPPGMVMAHDDALGRDRLYREDDYVQHAHDHELFVFDFTILRAYGNTEEVRPGHPT